MTVATARQRCVRPVEELTVELQMACARLGRQAALWIPVDGISSEALSSIDSTILGIRGLLIAIRARAPRGSAA